MYKIFQGMLVFVVFFGIYYALEKYETKQLTEQLQEMEIIAPNSLNKLSMVTYPAEQTYMSFDYQEVQDTYRDLKKLDGKKVKSGKERGIMMKVQFKEDGSQSFIDYYLYENGYIQLVEDAIAVYKNIYYQVDEEVVQTLVEELISGKSFD